MSNFLDRFRHLLGPMYVIPAVYFLGLCAYVGWLWMVMPASFWVMTVLFLRWWGVAMALMGVGAYLTGFQGHENDYVNKRQWGAFFFGFGLCWFFCGLYVI